jgi:ligand-binding sensor domain-containing protein/signal transduction histidine kinase
MLSLVVFQLCFFAADAQAPSVKFTHLTNQDGLSQSTVQAIVKDKYGFMWFGTQDGLNRYDGYSFRIYRHEPKNDRTLRRSHIVSLYEDRQGDLWVGTSNGALSKYDRNHDSFIHYKESTDGFPGLSQRTITTIYEDKQNNFWVGTLWKLNLLDRKTGKVTQFGFDASDPLSISSDGITTIFEDSKNNLWIGTNSGLNLFNRATKKFTRYLHDNTRSNSLSHDHVTAIKEDSRGRLWIGTADGLNLFDHRTGHFTVFKNDPGNPRSIMDGRVNAIEDEHDGSLWIGTASCLEFFDADKGVFTHFTSNVVEPTTLLMNGNIMSMLRDKDGILWVGTYQGGINKYDKYLTYFDTYRNKPSDPQSLSLNDVTAFAENADGSIWISTGGGALNLWEKTTNQFIRYNPDPANKNALSTWGLLCLYQSKKSNRLWIGTYGSGVDCYDPSTNTFRHYTKGDSPRHLNHDAVYAIFEDRRGHVWMGTNGGGINVLDPATGIITKYLSDANRTNTPSGDFIRCFYEDKKGNIWIGTSSGLCIFDPRRQDFIRYDQSSTQLESDVIFSLYEDEEGNMWVGTMGGGLNRINPATKNITVYTVNDGLPGNTVNSIVGDGKGNLWLSTNNGISCFNLREKSFRNSSLHNGIQSFEFSQGAGLKTSKGEILFGGVNGFNSFYPDDLKENRNIPPVVITGFKLFNKTVSSNDDNSLLKQDITQTRALTLTYDQSIITFEFAALGYTASEKNQYSFMLEGFDKKWSTGYQRSATYTNLDPGEYVFKVKGSNNDGIWNDKVTSLTITITPPFWRTWWFRIAVLGLIIAVILGIYIARVRREKQLQKILERKVKEQTVQLQLLNEEERNARQEAHLANEELEKKNVEMEQFVYIASHDLREPLRTTSSFIELFRKQYGANLDVKANTYLSYVTQSADRMKMLIDDLLDYSRIDAKKELQQVDCNIILQEVLADLDTALTEAGAVVKVDKLPVISGYPQGIKQLFQNLVTNGIKFRKKDVSPTIQIIAELQGNMWRFSFADNGIGIAPQHKEKIFVIFQRLHTKKEYEGSGIGLAHCKKIVEMHKGTIWVESMPGEGSVFYFTILKRNLP